MSRHHLTGFVQPLVIKITCLDTFLNRFIPASQQQSSTDKHGMMFIRMDGGHENQVGSSLHISVLSFCFYFIPFSFLYFLSLSSHPSKSFSLSPSATTNSPAFLLYLLFTAPHSYNAVIKSTLDYILFTCLSETTMDSQQETAETEIAFDKCPLKSQSLFYVLSLHLVSLYIIFLLSFTLYVMCIYLYFTIDTFSHDLAVPGCFSNHVVFLTSFSSFVQE